MNSYGPPSFVDVFVQRRFAMSNVHEQERPDSQRLEPCLNLYGIVYERSYLAQDGKRMLCHFRSPDAESLRMALQVARIGYDALWTAEVNDIPGAADFALVIERVFDHPLSLKQQRAYRAIMASRLQGLGVEPARVLLSRCGKRLLWLCRASTPDAAVNTEPALCGDGFDVWRCAPSALQARDESHPDAVHCNLI